MAQVQDEGMLTRRRTRGAVRDSSVPRNGMTLADLSELASQMQQDEEKGAPSTEGSTGSRGAPDRFQSIPRGRRRPSHRSSPCLRALPTSAGTGRDSRDSQASPTASAGASLGPPERLWPIWPGNGVQTSIALGPSTPSPPSLFNPIGALAALLSPSEAAPVTSTGSGPLPRNVVQNLLLLSLKRDPGCVVLASILAASPGLLRQLVSALTLVMEHEEKARAAAAAADALGDTAPLAGELGAWYQALSLSRNQPDRKARLTGVKREASWPSGGKKTADFGGASIVGGRRIQVSPVIPSPKEVVRLRTAQMHGYE